MKILYCVAGEGHGHWTRSLEVIRYISKKHKVRTLASGTSYKFMRLHLKDIEKIGGFNITYINNRLVFSLSFLICLIKLPLIKIYNLKMFKSFFSFKPDLIISDFEPFSSWLGFLTRTPVITVDNQHIIKTSVGRVCVQHALFSIFTNLFIPFRTKSLALSFFIPKNRDNKTIIVPPVLRKEIFNIKPKYDNFIMVYQTSKNYKRILKILNKFPDENFIIPDSKKHGKVGNVSFYGFDDKIFLDDLGNCKAVITNGGFSLISEALYLKKPVLSEPVRGQFEQYVNGYYVEKLGFGKFCRKLNTKVLREFISNLNIYNNNFDNHREKYNCEFFKVLDKTIIELVP